MNVIRKGGRITPPGEYRIAEAAKLIGVTPQTLHRHAREGRVKFRRWGLPGTRAPLLISADEVTRLRAAYLGGDGVITSAAGATDGA